jgi:hypothetical protein
MGIFSSGPSGDGTPNEKPYELRYEDGDTWRYDSGGRTQKQFSLASAILLANNEAGHGLRLYVVDPETGTVLWAGVRATR